AEHIDALPIQRQVVGSSEPAIAPENPAIPTIQRQIEESEEEPEHIDTLPIQRQVEELEEEPEHIDTLPVQRQIEESEEEPENLDGSRIQRQVEAVAEEPESVGESSAQRSLPKLPQILQDLSTITPLSNAPEPLSSHPESLTPITAHPASIVQRASQPAPPTSLPLQPLRDTVRQSSENRAITPIEPLTDANPYPDLHAAQIATPTLQRQPDPEPQPQADSPPTQPTETATHSTHGATSTENPAQNPDVDAQSMEKLEKLAQILYQQLRQRLALEQERSGNRYAGRLPW
ncbi:MAG: hypothetical protein VKJ24_10510, partial [Synechococcales bacterium]|nr:hypothetical protein [Synechococcales bacterium]